MERKYIGIDLPTATCQACALSQDGTRVWEAGVPRTVDGIAAWALVDAVTALGVHAGVVDPRKTKRKAGFAANTDRLEARRFGSCAS